MLSGNNKYFEWFSQANPKFKEKQAELHFDKKGLPRSQSFGCLNEIVFFRGEQLGSGQKGNVYKVSSTDEKTIGAVKKTRLVHWEVNLKETTFHSTVHGKAYLE